MTRTCGPCTTCCTVLPVEEIGKPQDHRCQHLGKTGCKIYANRPSSCARWSCRWLKDEGVAERLRPDRSHVVFDPVIDWILIDEETLPVHQVWVDPAFPFAYRHASVRAEMTRIAKELAMPCLVRIGPVGCIVFPPFLTGDYWLETEFAVTTDREEMERMAIDAEIAHAVAQISAG